MYEEWNNLASDWDNHMQEGDWFQRNIIYPEIMRILLSVEGKRIIDIGCGNGHLCRFLSKNGAKAVGIDNSQEMIECCKSYGSDIEYKRFDIAEDEIIDENLYDIAVFNNSLQDMEKFIEGINNSYRILKKNGKLLIVVKHPCFHGRSEECGWRVTTEDGQEFTTGYGLTDLESIKSSYTADYFLMNNYLKKSEHVREWYGSKTTSYARMLQDYFNAVIQAGFALIAVSEPMPIPSAQKENSCLYDLLKRIPNFIFIYCEK